MSQDITQTNTDFSATIAAARDKAAREVADVNAEAEAFITSRRIGSGPYVQPGAFDVSDSVGGLP